MLGYCGTGYHGLQINPPHKTIEEDLYRGFVAAGAISPENSSDLKKVAFMRAARTDKGVHAAGNIVSLKLIIEDPDIVQKINDNLPDQIRVYGISRTNKSFECRKLCSSRIYEYLIPSYSFLPPRPESSLAARLSKARTKYPNISREDTEGEKFWVEVKQALGQAGVTDADVKKIQTVYEDREEAEMEKNNQRMKEARDYAQKRKEAIARGETFTEELVNTISNTQEEAEPVQEVDPEFLELVEKVQTVENYARRKYRVSSERLDLIRETFKQYEGVYNFHNYTIRKKYTDPSAKRYMKNVTVSEPKLIGNTEWLSIKIHGQSFMMHQIRKMVAMSALIVRCGTPITRIKDSFGSEDINIPKAPGLGLLLEQPVYEGYNSKLETLGYDPISFEKWQDQVETFKFKHIYDKIYAKEEGENVFAKFFEYIDAFRGDSAFGYLAAGFMDTVKQEDGVVAGAGQLLAKEEFVMDDEEEDINLPANADTEG